MARHIIRNIQSIWPGTEPGPAFRSVKKSVHDSRVVHPVGIVFDLFHGRPAAGTGPVGTLEAGAAGGAKVFVPPAQVCDPGPVGGLHESAPHGRAAAGTDVPGTAGDEAAAGADVIVLFEQMGASFPACVFHKNPFLVMNVRLSPLYIFYHRRTSFAPHFCGFAPPGSNVL